MKRMCAVVVCVSFFHINGKQLSLIAQHSNFFHLSFTSRTHGTYWLLLWIEIRLWPLFEEGNSKNLLFNKFFWKNAVVSSNIWCTFKQQSQCTKQRLLSDNCSSWHVLKYLAFICRLYYARIFIHRKRQKYEFYSDDKIFVDLTRIMLVNMNVLLFIINEFYSAKMNAKDKVPQ